MTNLSANWGPSYETVPSILLLHTLFVNIHDKYFGGGAVSVVQRGEKPLLLDEILKAVAPVVLSQHETPTSMSTAGMIVLGDVPWVPLQRPQAPVLIITENDKPAVIKTWLQLFWSRHRFPDATILVINSEITFFTFFPFATQCGAEIEPDEIDIKHLHSKKFDGNLNKCPIRVMSDWLMPYVSRQGESPEPGVEDLIFSEIVRKLNGTVQEVKLPEGENPQLTRNATGDLTGGAHLLHIQQMDIMYSGFSYRADLLGEIEMLAPHTIDSLAWFVPSPQPIPGPAYLYLAFSPQVWLQAALALLLTTGCLLLHTPTLLTDVTALTLNLATSHQVPRLLRAFGYTYSLHITAIYQASLFMLFARNVMEKPIETIEEAADAELVGYFFNYHRPLINQSDFGLWKKLLAKTNFRDRQNPERFAGDRNFFLLVQFFPVLYYIEKRRIYDAYGPALLPLKERFIMNPVTMYGSRGNPLLPYVESITQHLVDSGLVRYWLENVVAPSASSQNIFIDGQITLTWFHLSGAFGLLIAGLIVAVLCFGMELLFFKCRVVKKKLQGKEANHNLHCRVTYNRSRIFID